MAEKILGLDIGPNSIGWCIISKNMDDKNRIVDGGVRILPSDGKQLSYYVEGRSLTNSSGQSISKAATRRTSRSQRRNNNRYKLRRDRLLLVLDMLGLQPNHITYTIDKNGKYPDVTVLNLVKNRSENTAEGFVLEQHPAWQQYEIRNRAVIGVLSAAELGRVLYHLNQRRGYQDIGLLGEEETAEIKDRKLKPNQRIEEITILSCSEKPVAFKKIGKKSKPVFEVTYLTTDEQTLSATTLFDAGKRVNKKAEYKLETDKEAKVEIRLYAKTNWTKGREENNQSLKGRTIGQTLFEELNNEVKPWDVKIRKRVFDRKYHKQEFDKVWEMQSQHHPVLENCPKELLIQVVQLMYPLNTEKQHELLAKGLKQIIKEHIIYYQRKLKSQKSTIEVCRFENRIQGENKQSGQKYARPVKRIPKSHPMFQEFRLWSVINNLRIDNKEKVEFVLEPEQRAILFDLLAGEDRFDTELILKKLKLSRQEYKVNLRTESTFYGLRTQSQVNKILKKSKTVLSNEQMEKLWHLLYSVNGKEPRSKALIKFQDEQANLVFNEAEINELSKLNLEKGYGSLSRKALLKILPLMKPGKYFDVHTIHPEVAERIQARLYTDEPVDKVGAKLHERLSVLETIEQFQGMRYDEAAEFVYDTHTRPQMEAQYEKAGDVKLLKNNSLRQPVVEQVVNEVIRLLRDIWNNEGLKPAEIRVEMARDLKNNIKERERQYTASAEMGKKIRNDILPKVQELTGSKYPSKNQLLRYRLWLEQDRKCMYADSSNGLINCTDLYRKTGEGKDYYDIDHILPRRRLFDDSYMNKVLVRRELNALKDRSLARTFIEKEQGKNGVRSWDSYIEDVNRLPKPKRDRLLMTEKEFAEYADDFIERQKKETQYIAVRVIEELSKFVGSDKVYTTTGGITDLLREHWGLYELMMNKNEERFRRLEKKIMDAGRTDLMEKDAENNETLFFKKNNKLSRVIHFNKRVDNRHHFVDALTIACTTPRHVKFINDLNVELQDKSGQQGLRDLLTEKTSKKDGWRFKKPWDSIVTDTSKKLDEIIISYRQKTEALVPAENKIQAAGRNIVQKDIVSIKGELHNAQPSGLRVLKEEMTWVNYLNYLQKHLEFIPNLKSHIEEELASSRQAQVLISALEQTKWDIEACKKGLKELIVKNITEEALKKAVIVKRKYIAYRKELSQIKKKEDIENIFGESIKAEIRQWIEQYDGIEDAFSDENIELFNIERIAAGKMRIKKVTLLQNEPMKPGGPNEVILRKKSFNSKAVFSKDEKVHYVIIENQLTGVRTFKTISLLDFIRRTQSNEPVILLPENHQYYLLSKHFLMYVPSSEEERVEKLSWKSEQWNAQRTIISKRLYKFSRISGEQWYFIPHHYEPVYIKEDKENKLKEFNELAGSTQDIERDMYSPELKIKEAGIPLSVDRLGNIKPVIGQLYDEPIEPLHVLEEPQAAYMTPKITSFDSFEDMENDQLSYFAGLSPQEVLRNLKLMVLPAFGYKEEPPFSKMPRTIYFNNES